MVGEFILDLSLTDFKTPMERFRLLGGEQLGSRIIERVREERFDPPLFRNEIAIEFLQNVYRGSTDEFKGRFEAVFTAHLRSIRTSPDFTPEDDVALKNMGVMVTTDRIKSTYPEIRKLADQGGLSGNSRFNPDTEQWVLAAVLNTQPEGILDPMWTRLWQHPESKIYSMAFNGIRRYSPQEAIELLPELFSRGRGRGYNLLVWYLYQDFKSPEDFKEELSKLPEDVRTQVAQELAIQGVTI